MRILSLLLLISKVAAQADDQKNHEDEQDAKDEGQGLWQIISIFVLSDLLDNLSGPQDLDLWLLFSIGRCLCDLSLFV